MITEMHRLNVDPEENKIDFIEQYKEQLARVAKSDPGVGEEYN